MPNKFGKSPSSALLTNEGRKLSEEDIRDKINSEIIGLSIQAIPLIHNKAGNMFVQCICKTLTLLFLHPRICSITPSHLAIQLTLKNGYIVIIEYGPFITEIDDALNDTKSRSFSLKDYREEETPLSYYYINDDGVRLTILNEDAIRKYENLIESMNYLSNLDSQQKRAEIYLLITTYKHFFYKNISDLLLSLRKKINNPDNPRLTNLDGYNIIECEIEQSMDLVELCNKFKGTEWKAGNYNLAHHNCQNFAAEVIKILKAVRKNDFDKIRSREKLILPNCIISNLWDNEKHSWMKTIGRIPLLGPIHDIYFYFHLKKKSNL